MKRNTFYTRVLPVLLVLFLAVISVGLTSVALSLRQAKSAEQEQVQAASIAAQLASAQVATFDRRLKLIEDGRKQDAIDRAQALKNLNKREDAQDDFNLGILKMLKPKDH